MHMLAKGAPPLESAPPRKTAKQLANQRIDEEIPKVFHPSQFNWGNVDWGVVLWIGAMHVGAVAAFFFFNWQAFAVAVVLWWATGSLGICLGFHRYLSHRSLKLSSPARFFLYLCGTLAAEGPPLTWAANHRLHHAKSDKPGDPHSPLHGPWWSHMFWTMADRTQKFEEGLIDRYAPDLRRDKIAVFFQKTFILWSIALGVGLYALGGLPMLLWGLCFRMVFLYHCTWFVNSATHLWGYRNYETVDASRNLWWVAVLAHGEGWHNNHHAFPALARAGHRWWEVDITFMAIRTLQFFRQAWDVKDEIPAPKSIPPAPELESANIA